jgi:hypothetical protein
MEKFKKHSSARMMAMPLRLSKQSLLLADFTGVL